LPVVPTRRHASTTFCAPRAPAARRCWLTWFLTSLLKRREASGCVHRTEECAEFSKLRPRSTVRLGARGQVKLCGRCRQ
jgi:hypothetical protein